MSDPILQTRGLCKEFKGFAAVSDIHLEVEHGSIHALIGPNGAGKTTVFNLLTKFLAPTSGQVIFDGVDITAAQPAEVANKGLIRSFQISAVFPNMSTLDNIRVALLRIHGGAHRFWRSKQELNAFTDTAMDLLEEVGLAEFSHVLAGELAYGRKRALEIATTLALKPKLMLLDEPTQGMGIEDVERVTALIRRASVGRTILMVEHNLKVVSTLADKITVLARGQHLSEGDYATVSADPRVMEAYLGISPAISASPQETLHA
ncbi:ABC transporter ATP-binding protein [Iodobacter fluviatilis]|uniref:Amino acid/amide ABC transporter ATP-binding protein 1 (HAAT family) n=1 Tax=Iodobacter fluviatilis TaxID=537 RepID=A0A377Q9T3_9NEIS|nr:ABC transporter ATP-binding protein [Iodobacter fluviatilis]TCU88438.1 amino acid/amide ABC transporter ATP-binding protein 1 (HAAT family) [Iodobacter fluviatilis]STQ91490.1 Lipopolysaccharide export system ATP-binding protein LptB [Iodobacter fluviatilis]